MIDINKEDKIMVNFSEEENIIVFGSGTVAASCIKYLRQVFEGSIWVFENRQSDVSILEKQLTPLNAVQYEYVGDNIINKVKNINAKIIFSINNTYIFPDELICNHIIINYHNALLPLHPGRFAEAWTIYNRDPFAGVTFHLVTNQVDKGRIVLQKSIQIDDSFTSIKLLMIQTKVAIELFKNIINMLKYDEEITLFEQENVDGDCKLHYSFEKPSNGVLDYAKSGDEISAFLRAMDYGALDMLGKPIVVYNRKKFIWRKYSILKEMNREEVITIVENDMVIRKKNYSIVLKDLQVIED